MLLAYDFRNNPFIPMAGISDRQWVDARPRFRTFSRVAATAQSLTTLTDAGDPVRLQEATVTAGLFETLGIVPAVGRTFALDDERVGGEPVVILGDALWRERFGADPRVVGRSITLDGIRHTVVGVMSPATPGDDHVTPVVVRQSSFPVAASSAWTNCASELPAYTTPSFTAGDVLIHETL